ncbi:hypothetical protein [Xenorhabdus szentirmaii]|uniref:hypothetical protein n=1 Tax=Xenorhabdus szentirmaii TaxID=290112 RepID=UPI0004B86EB5|nr:hypothetical protein [Xenorhabdus szentirmaii]
MGLGDEIITRIARVGATHARPPLPPGGGARGPAAARQGDPIQHKSFFGALMGAVAGALIGAAIFGAVGLFVAGTGGLGRPCLSRPAAD